MKRSVKLRHRSSSCRDLPLLCIAVVAAGLLAACAQVPGRVHKISPAVSGEPLVYMSDDGGSSAFWLVEADRPATRQLLQSMPHAPGWSGRAALAPNGSTLAYTLLGRNSSDPDHEAQIWLLNLEDRQTVLFVAGVDLRSALVWSADSSSIAYEHRTGTRGEIWERSFGADPEFVAASPAGAELIPFAFGPDGTLLAALYDQGGTDIVGVQPGDARQTRHVSNGVARDLVLSPDGGRAAFVFDDDATAPSSGGGTVDLRTGATARLPHRWGEIIGVAWTAANRLTAGSTGMAAGIRDESGDVVVASRDGGFDQPLAWSPSGRYLAVRHFRGQTGGDPGAASELVVKNDGARFDLTTGQPARFVGWLAPYSNAGQR
jgi:hypothetical protein